MKITFSIIVFYILSLNVAFSEDITIGKKISIHSEILNEDRELWLSLPPNHDPKKDYPVIYILDSERNFHYSSGVLMQFAMNGKMPEAIMVAIPNTDRNRDLTPTHTDPDIQGNPKTSGGGDNFLNFIKTELSPYIEENYTTSEYRVLIGHSLGGLIATHALLEYADFFNAFIAIDPSFWWDDTIMNKHLLEKITEERTATNIYYMTSANNGVGNEMLSTQIEFMENLAKWNTDTLNFKRDYYDNDDHGSVDLISIYKGLEYIFENYKVDYEKATEDPAYLKNHFENFSQRAGYKFSVTENAVNRLGYTFLYNKQDQEKALELFIQNTKDYPNSSNTYDSLSDAYKEIGNRDMVIKSLEKAIELDPNAEGSKIKLKYFLGSDNQ